MATTAPTFTLTKTFCIGDADFDAAFVLDLLQNKGFRYTQDNIHRHTLPNGKAAKRKVKVRRRFKKRVPLSAERVREFRKARADGKSYRRIGSIFGVSEGRAWQIVNKGK